MRSVRAKEFLSNAFLPVYRGSTFLCSITMVSRVLCLALLYLCLTLTVQVYAQSNLSCVEIQVIAKKGRVMLECVDGRTRVITGTASFAMVTWNNEFAFLNSDSVVVLSAYKFVTVERGDALLWLGCHGQLVRFWVGRERDRINWYSTVPVLEVRSCTPESKFDSLHESWPKEAVILEAKLNEVLFASPEPNLDLKILQKRVSKQQQGYAETGIVSVEVGSACLDTASATSSSGSTIPEINTQIEATNARVRIKIRLPDK